VRLLDLVRAHQPDLVVTDIRTPPTHRTEALAAGHRIRAEFRTSGLSCCRPMSRSRRLWSCWPVRSGWVTCSRARVTDVQEFIETLDRVGQGDRAVDPITGRGTPRRAAQG
jgi:hypothetical protein